MASATALLPCSPTCMLERTLMVMWRCAAPQVIDELHAFREGVLAELVAMQKDVFNDKTAAQMVRLVRDREIAAIRKVGLGFLGLQRWLGRFFHVRGGGQVDARLRGRWPSRAGGEGQEVHVLRCSLVPTPARSFPTLRMHPPIWCAPTFLTSKTCPPHTRPQQKAESREALEVAEKRATEAVEQLVFVQEQCEQQLRIKELETTGLVNHFKDKWRSEFEKRKKLHNMVCRSCTFAAFQA